jgi:hypothetical protein
VAHLFSTPRRIESKDRASSKMESPKNKPGISVLSFRPKNVTVNSPRITTTSPQTHHKKPRFTSHVFQKPLQKHTNRLRNEPGIKTTTRLIQRSAPTLPGDTLRIMPGPTLEQKLEHLTIALAEAEREYAAGVPYPGPGSWPETIAKIKRHLANLREIMANE